MLTQKHPMSPAVSRAPAGDGCREKFVNAVVTTVLPYAVDYRRDGWADVAARVSASVMEIGIRYCLDKSTLVTNSRRFIETIAFYPGIAEKQN